jgi:hypothetical protein
MNGNTCYPSPGGMIYANWLQGLTPQEWIVWCAVWKVSCRAGHPRDDFGEHTAVEVEFGQREIEKLCGINHRFIDRHIRSLVEKGLLEDYQPGTANPSKKLRIPSQVTIPSTIPTYIPIGNNKLSVIDQVDKIDQFKECLPELPPLVTPVTTSGNHSNHPGDSSNQPEKEYSTMHDPIPDDIMEGLIG